MAMRRFGNQPPTAPAAPAKPDHVGFDRCFVNEDELSQLRFPALSPPRPASLHDVRTILFGGVQGLFFNVRSSLSSVSQIRVVLASTLCTSNSQTFSSSSVAS